MLSSKRITITIIILGLLIPLLVGCGTSEAQSASEDSSESAVEPTDAASEEPAETPDVESEEAATEEAADTPVEAEPTEEDAAAEPEPEGPTPTPWPEDWREMPIVPQVTDTALEVYQRGIELGRDPNSFSIIGDCQNIPEFFLGGFEDPARYNLADYEYLQEVIDNYAAAQSFTRLRVTANPGYNVASVLSPLWTEAEVCDPRENPLECELRVNNPSVAIINMETWWYDRPAESYAGYLRQIVEFLIENGVVPIIGTKADNLEGDWSINAAMVQVAEEYDIPVWNFWASVQHLPGAGLRVDEGDYFHLTYTGPWFHFYQLDSAWPVRNLTALQTLDSVWRGLNGLEPAETMAES